MSEAALLAVDSVSATTTEPACIATFGYFGVLSWDVPGTFWMLLLYSS
jgi:hypothetical protein